MKWTIYLGKKMEKKDDSCREAVGASELMAREVYPKRFCSGGLCLHPSVCARQCQPLILT